MSARWNRNVRQRRARLANMRHELLAPVTALVGYSELLIEKARGLELEDIGPDLQRILISAQELLELIDGCSRPRGFLVVDDNASNRDLLFRRLSHDGHHVARADSGHQALEILGACA